MREVVLAAFLALSGALITAGIAIWSPAAALIAGGVLLGVWSWLVFAEVDTE